MNKMVKIFFVLLLSSLWLVGCSPINYFTKVKNTPKEYSRNYCCGEVAVPNSVDKRTPWIVYSDRNRNATFYNPGGKVQMKEAAFLEPFAVIGEKGDFLKLVKFDPKFFENGQIKDKSKVEYYGWMHKENLLLSSRPATDVATGFVIKMMTMVKDTNPIVRSSDFFSENSVVLFHEPELLTPKAQIPFQQPIFLAKKSADKRKCLVVGKESFTPENASSMVAGWVSSSLVMPLGEYLYWNYKEVPFESAWKEDVNVSSLLHEENFEASELPDFKGWHPIYSICNQYDSLSVVRTTVNVPLMDDKRNFVFGLSGAPIRRPMLDKMTLDRKHINVMLVFSDQRQVFDKFGQLASSFRHLAEIFRKHESNMTFRLGYEIGFENDGKNMRSFPLSTDIDTVLASLERYGDGLINRPVSFSGDAWKALKQSFRWVSDYKEECNVFVLIGENGNYKSQVESSVIDNLVELNARLVGCQIYSDQGNSFNNFVLQVEDMISRSSAKLSQKKRHYLVHSEQLSMNNQYREISENVYALDYPRNSMWQGWILFPKKKELLPPDMLVSVVDSIVAEIVSDNEDILSRIQKAFKQAGVGRTSMYPTWLELNGIDGKFELNPILFQPMSTLDPYTRFSVNLQVEKANMEKGKYFLFLTEKELNRIKSYMQDVTKYRVDYKYSSSQKSTKERGRSCLDLEEHTQVSASDSLPHRYLNTSKSRKKMRNAFVEWARDEKVYPQSKRKLKRMTLSKNQQVICSLPSFNKEMNRYVLKDLRKKKRIVDREIDELQEYFLRKEKLLDEAIASANRFEFNGQIYYRIEADCLP